MGLLKHFERTCCLIINSDSWHFFIPWTMGITGIGRIHFSQVAVRGLEFIEVIFKHMRNFCIDVLEMFAMRPMWWHPVSKKRYHFLL